MAAVTFYSLFTPDRTFPQKEGAPRFVCDSHLGRLARLLRLMGWDTLWRVDWTEPAIVRQVVNQRRTALSRSRGLLTRRELRGSLLIASDQPDQQAAQVVRVFELADRICLWGRCTRCNGKIEPVTKESVADRIPPKTARWLDEYHLCADCDQLYWQGTHTEALAARIANIVRMSRL
jgi:uncharacterized protein with PIN domain